MTMPNLSGLSDTVAILVALWLLAKTFMGTRNVDKAALDLLAPYREELTKAHCDVERLRDRVRSLDLRVQGVEAQNEELRRYVRRLLAQLESLGLTPVCTLNTESLGLISNPVETEED